VTDPALHPSILVFPFPTAVHLGQQKAIIQEKFYPLIDLKTGAQRMRVVWSDAVHTRFIEAVTEVVGIVHSFLFLCPLF
jgi:hypothetical protein